MTTYRIPVGDLENRIKESPFHKLLQLRLESVDVDTRSVALYMPFVGKVERMAGSGQFHGGVIASLIDIAGDYALVWALGFSVPTINFRVDYLRVACRTGLRATAKVRRVGRSIGVVDVDVTDDQIQLIAIGRGCYSTKAG